MLLIPLFILTSRRNGFTVRKIVFLGVSLSMAIAIGMFESLFPDFFIPGFKLGLANIIILILLYGVGWSEALVVDILRVLLVSLLRGNFLTMGGFMSFAGAALSFLGMLLIKILWKKASLFFVSVAGAILHDAGQILVGFFYLENATIFAYLPFMVLISFVTGAFCAFVAREVLRRKALDHLLKSKDS